MFEKFLKNALQQTSIFESFVTNIGHHECRDAKGMIWESFTKRFLRCNFDQVYSIHEFDVQTYRRLPRKDVGIDFIVSDGLSYSAVQAKFRQNARQIPWRQFSTFDALCNRTGPWKNRIIITNCDRVNIYGNKNKNDVFYGKRFFGNMSKGEWKRILYFLNN